jgi:hypothetical protein
MPVSSLSCWKVLPVRSANRSNALRSRYEKERAPSRTAAAIPSRGTPAPSRLLIQRALSTSLEVKTSPSPGVIIPSSTSRSTYSGSTPAFVATSWRDSSSTRRGP